VFLFPRLGLGRSADIANGAVTSKPTPHLCHVRGSHFLQLLSYLFPIQELINPNNLPYYLGHTTGFSKKVIFAELDNNGWEVLTGFSPETVDSDAKVAVLNKRGETAPTLPLDSVCFSIPPLFPPSLCSDLISLSERTAVGSRGLQDRKRRDIDPVAREG